MIATDCGRRMGTTLVALAALGGLGPEAAWAQKGRADRGGTAPSRPTEAAKPAPADVPVGQVKVLPVNPNDAVAVINGQAISRRQLADECVARRGKEILDTLIARALIDQALLANKLQVTAAEIDAEIEKTAQGFGLGREALLRSMDKERGVSPAQYARDIVYPTIAMRKLAAPQVQVTTEDMKDAFEAHFGDRLRIRVIMVDKLRTAQEIWEELKKNPGGFEKIAQERSIDQQS